MGKLPECHECGMLVHSGTCLCSGCLTEWTNRIATKPLPAVTRERLIGILHAHWATGGGELGELHQLFVPKPIAEIMANRIEDAIDAGKGG